MTVSEISGGGFQGVSYVAVLGGSPGSFPGIADSDLYLPLKNTLVPTRGASTPTFTRATVAWDFDSEGKLNLNIPSGCPRFTGARFVRNLLTIPTEDLTNAGWTKADTTITANAIANSVGVITADKLVEAATTAAHTVNSLNGFSVVTGLSYTVSVEVKKAERTKAFFGVTTTFPTTFISVDLDTGVVATAVGSPLGAKSTNLGNDWWRVEFNVAATSTGFGVVDCRTSLDGVWANRFFLGELTKGIFVTRFQIENVTGQADQTASEYVSVGVLSAPFHGAGVDGCKYFNTNKNGSAISAATLKGYLAEPSRVNNCLWGRDQRNSLWDKTSTGAELLTNGTFAAATDWTTSGAGYFSVGGGVLNINATDATAAYADNSQLFALLVPGKQYVVEFDYVKTSGGSPDVNLRGTSGKTVSSSTGRKSITITCGSSVAGYGLRFGQFGACVGTIDNVSVKEAAIQVTTTPGLDNVANSASRLTATANDATLLQLLTAATGTRTTSAWIKAITLTQKPELSPGGGTFDSSFGWTLGSWTIGGGVASIVASPGSILRIASSPAALGKVFVFSYTITSISGANVQAHAGGTLGVLRSTPGTYTESIVCGSVDTLVGIAALSGATATIDNLSIKESAISLTRNGGTGWTDITSSLVAGTWVPVEVTSDVGANPTVGLKMGTSGDVIDVDCFQDENGAWRTSPILTTTAAVTRNADVLSYASAFDVAQGTALCQVRSAIPINSGSQATLLDSAACVMLYLTSASARTSTGSYDGTNSATIAGCGDITTGVRKRAVRWGADLKISGDGSLGVATAFDGAMGSTGTLEVGSENSISQISGNIGEVHIWTSALTDAQMQQVTT